VRQVHLVQVVELPDLRVRLVQRALRAQPEQLVLLEVLEPPVRRAQLGQLDLKVMQEPPVQRVLQGRLEFQEFP